MTKTGIAALIIVLALAGLIGYGIYQGSSTPDQLTTEDMGNPPVQPEDTSTSPTPTSTTSVTPTPTTAGTVKSFTVNGGNFFFTPSTLTVNKGDTVKITFKNTGGIHDLRIDEFQTGTQRIQSGQEETFSFVANKTGTFEYYCSVGEHRAMGMKGTLTVK
jgi:plastocyanin